MAKLTRARAQEAAQEAEHLQGAIDDVTDSLATLIDFAEIWGDDEADRESRAEAREEIEGVWDDLPGLLDTLTAAAADLRAVIAGKQGASAR